MNIHCLGDSITEGWGLDSPATQSFPYLLQQKFPEHRFFNYGSAGAMVQPQGGYGYEDTLAYHHAMAHPADLNLLLLGSNDGYAWNPNFKNEYRRLVSSLKQPLILITPPKMALEGTSMEKIREDILETAKELDLPVIDLYTASDPSWLSSDGVHPGAEGQKKIAAFLAGQLDGLLKNYE